MNRVDAFLSRKASAHWPGALVMEDSLGFVLLRESRKPLHLAAHPTPPDKRFGAAREALAQVIRHEQPGPQVDPFVILAALKVTIDMLKLEYRSHKESQDERRLSYCTSLLECIQNAESVVDRAEGE